MSIPRKAPLRPGSPLIEREIQVLELYCEGLKPAEIARRIGIGHVNVDRRLRGAALKLGAKTVPHGAILFDRMRREEATT